MPVQQIHREVFFNDNGYYGTEEEIIDYVERNSKKSNHNTDGSKNSFYDIPEWVKDVDDLAEYLDLKGDAFNCLKALFGIGLGSRHEGTDPKRDAKKLKHYADRIERRYDK